MMKKMIVFLLFVAFISCEKEDLSHFSDKYLGQYECVKRYSKLDIAPANSMNPIVVEVFDTLIIKVERSGVSSDVILLDGIKVVVNEDETLNSYHTEPINCGRGDGYFNGDSVYFLQSDRFCEDYTWYKGVKLAED